MAPIKFDENIKEKLEKRSLQPSSDAWQTLSNTLDAETKKQNRGLFFYIGIAASIVGVVFVTTLFFNASEGLQPTPKVVETETIDNLDKTTVIPTSKGQTDLVESSVKEKLQDNQDSKTDVIATNPTQKNTITVAHISEEKKADLDHKKEKQDLKMKTSLAVVDHTIKTENGVTPINTLTPEDAKVLDVLNKIKLLNADGIAATDQEIDDLLKQAEKEILKERIYNETTRTVDANALLQDVEADLEQSFRTKVFDALKSSYKTVKTAVAERNN